MLKCFKRWDIYAEQCSNDCPAELYFEESLDGGFIETADVEEYVDKMEIANLKLKMELDTLKSENYKLTLQNKVLKVHVNVISTLDRY